MKKFLMALVFGMFLFSASPAFAWDCPSGQIRQQAPPGTPTTTPYYDVVEGIAFICVPATPATNPTSTNSNSASSSNSTSSANGGNASATGGNQKQQQTSNSTVTNSGNSSNTNTSNSTASNNGNGNGNGSNDSTYSSTTNVASSKIPVAPAAPVTILPANPCFKGIGAGIQTMAFGGSFGGGKIDGNCAILEAARLAPSLLARCKVYVSNKYVKQAGVTLQDCLTQPEPAAPISQVSAPEQPVTPPAPVLATITVPAPQVTVNLPPAVASIPVAAASKPRVRWIPYNGKYAGQELVVVGPFEGLCDVVDLLIKTGVPRANISAHSSDKDSKVRIYVVIKQ